MPTITLVGDRQAGKTHALLTIGAADAVAGKTVLYITELSPVNAFTEYQQIAELLGEYRAYRQNGAERVVHPSGGVIHFTPPNRWRAPALADIDTLLLDEVHGHDYAGIFPNIRVFRTSSS